MTSWERHQRIEGILVKALEAQGGEIGESIYHSGPCIYFHELGCDGTPVRVCVSVEKLAAELERELP